MGKRKRCILYKQEQEQEKRKKKMIRGISERLIKESEGKRDTQRECDTERGKEKNKKCVRGWECAMKKGRANLGEKDRQRERG